jgi:hypothetical protein
MIENVRIVSAIEMKKTEKVWPDVLLAAQYVKQKNRETSTTKLRAQGDRRS